MTLLRYFPTLVAERAGRLVLFLAAAGLLLGPALRVLRVAGGQAADGVAAGMRAGLAATGRHPLGGWLGLLLVAGALGLFAGCVAQERRSGEYRILLARPVSRPGYYLAKWLASLCCYVAGAAALAGAAAWAGAGSGLPFSPAGAAATALLYGLAIGGPLFLASVWLDHGDWVAVAALVLLPTALERLALAGSPAAAAADRALGPLLPPADIGHLRDALLAGGLPAVGDVASVLAYGLAALGVALLSIHLGEHRPR